MRGAAPLLLVAVACGDPGPRFSAAQPITVEKQAWNANGADLGRIAAVAELEEDVVVFGDQGAFVLSGAVVNAGDASVSAWRAAATIPAADRSGDWALGVDGSGRLHRLRARSILEEVSDRYGLLGDPVSGVASLGGSGVAFLLDGAVAVADGMLVTRYDGVAISGAAGGRGRLAGIAPDGSVNVLDPGAARRSTYPIADAAGAAFQVDGKLHVLARHELLAEDGGWLASIYQEPGADFHGIAAAGGRVWLGIGGELAMYDGDSFSRTSGLAIPPDAVLLPSASGDVWVLAGGRLERYGTQAGPDEDQWRKTVLPIYAGVCSDCHSPGGPSGVSLASYKQWDKLRMDIYRRVIVKGDMPQGRTLSEPDKLAIEQWSMPR